MITLMNDSKFVLGVLLLFCLLVSSIYSAFIITVVTPRINKLNGQRPGNYSANFFQTGLYLSYFHPSFILKKSKNYQKIKNNYRIEEKDLKYLLISKYISRITIASFVFFFLGDLWVF
jgi:hypothetical protein